MSDTFLDAMYVRWSDSLEEENGPILEDNGEPIAMTYKKAGKGGKAIKAHKHEPMYPKRYSIRTQRCGVKRMSYNVSELAAAKTYIKMDNAASKIQAAFKTYKRHLHGRIETVKTTGPRPWQLQPSDPTYNRALYVYNDNTHQYYPEPYILKTYTYTEF